MFSPAFFVRCPNCNAKHEHRNLWSFNDFWSEECSDGFITCLGKDSIQKCSICNFIIENTDDLKNLGEVEVIKIFKPQTFWQKLFRCRKDWTIEKPEAAPSLNYLNLNDWARATKEGYLSESTKRYCERKLMWEFNQIRRRDLDISEQDKLDAMELAKFVAEIEDKYLEKAEFDYSDGLQLLAADIYRRRSKFDSALNCLNRISSNEYTKKLMCMKKWINEGKTDLGIYPAKYDWNT